jgi:hypothetical protein
MNLAIMTIGNRDVDLSIECLEEKKKGCRSFGNYILVNYSKFKDKVNLPIIEPMLRSFERKNITLDIVYLIATNQENNDYHKFDTISFAKVIKKDFERQKISTKIIELKEDVNNFNKNYSFFKTRLEQISRKEFDKVFILPVGGMPNINTPLLFASILVFEEKIEQYYTTKEKDAIPVPFNKKFLWEIEQKKLCHPINNYLFSTVSDISSDSFVKRIAKIGYDVSIFDIDSALSDIDEMILDFPEENLNTLLKDCNSILQNNDKRIEMIFYCAILKIKQEQYVDSLMRLYNFTDNLLLTEVCRLYSLDFDMNKRFEKWWKNSVKEIRQSNDDIENLLNPINDTKADLNKSGIPLYKELILFKEQDNKFLGIIDPLLKICKLRNKSIAAHGFESISIKKINDKLSEYDLNLDSLIAKIENLCNIRFDNSIFAKIQHLLNDRS